MFKLIGKAIVPVLKTILSGRKSVASKKNNNEKYNSNSFIAFFLVVYMGATGKGQTEAIGYIYLRYAPGGANESTRQLS